MYICPDCFTFYCRKCAETLSSLENECWVCNAPFDEKKQIKPSHKEEFEEKIEIEKEIHENYSQKKKNDLAINLKERAQEPKELSKKNI